MDALYQLATQEESTRKKIKWSEKSSFIKKVQRSQGCRASTEEYPKMKLQKVTNVKAATKR